MSRLTAAQRKALPKSDFVFPSKAPGPGSYPIPDKGHAAVAKSMAAKFATPSQEKTVDADANKKLGKVKPKAKKKVKKA